MAAVGTWALGGPEAQVEGDHPGHGPPGVLHGEGAATRTQQGDEGGYVCQPVAGPPVQSQDRPSITQRMSLTEGNSLAEPTLWDQSVEVSLSKTPHPHCSKRAGCRCVGLTPPLVCECVY